MAKEEAVEGEVVPLKLNPRQMLFCQLYVSKEFFGNGVEAYAEAYDLDIRSKKDYRTASTNASRLLINADILEYLNTLLDEAGLNDAFVDKQLLFLINQQKDFKAKAQAIKEYNTLKKRVDQKSDAVEVVKEIRNVLSDMKSIVNNEQDSGDNKETVSE